MNVTARGTLAFDANANFTLSAWLNPDVAYKVVGDDHSLPVYIGTNGGYALNYWFRDANSSPGQLTFYRYNGSSVVSADTPGRVIKGNRYQNVVAVKNGSNLTLYLDGQVIATGKDITFTGQTVTTVTLNNNGNYSGGIDEVAIWNRVLTDGSSSTPNEILELYRRGANRAGFQYRTCSLRDCSDKATASWIGPDGTNRTWFSELQNMSAITASGDGSGTINLTGPLMNFANWVSALPKWKFSPTPALYFQYRVWLESDDENNLCSGAPCLPQISTISTSTGG
ncbi:MAG: hypothetical protein C5B49_15030 [Bdellovibrio sp.]|nr:MAG: hypothetical protein C5B49_15030 [Bdellovibrio sp.]